MSTELSDYREKVFRFFIQKTRNEHQANDLTQEVFLRVINNKDQLNSISDINAWIFRISKNILIDHYRKNSKSREISIAQETSTSTIDMDQKKLMESILECQHKFIDQLDPETRHLILKADIEGMSQKELAQDSNMVYATLRSKIQRGRTQLKKMFLQACEMEYDAAGQISSCEDKSSCSSDC